MTSPYLDRPRSIDDARFDLRIRRYSLMADQVRALEAGNQPVADAIDQQIDAIDRRLMILDGWFR